MRPAWSWQAQLAIFGEFATFFYSQGQPPPFLTHLILQFSSDDQICPFRYPSYRFHKKAKIDTRRPPIRQGTSFQYQKSHLDLVVWYWSLFVSSSSSIQTVRWHCYLSPSPNWPNIYSLRKVEKKIGQGPPPPHLDKIQKNSIFFREIFPKGHFHYVKIRIWH